MSDFQFDSFTGSEKKDFNESEKKERIGSGARLNRRDCSEVVVSAKAGLYGRPGFNTWAIGTWNRDGTVPNGCPEGSVTEGLQSIFNQFSENIDQGNIDTMFYGGAPSAPQVVYSTAYLRADYEWTFDFGGGYSGWMNRWFVYDADTGAVVQWGVEGYKIIGGVETSGSSESVLGTDGTVTTTSSGTVPVYVGSFGYDDDWEAVVTATGLSVTATGKTMTLTLSDAYTEAEAVQHAVDMLAQVGLSFYLPVSYHDGGHGAQTYTPPVDPTTPVQKGWHVTHVWLEGTAKHIHVAANDPGIANSVEFRKSGKYPYYDAGNYAWAQKTFVHVCSGTWGTPAPAWHIDDEEAVGASPTSLGFWETGYNTIANYSARFTGTTNTQASFAGSNDYILMSPRSAQVINGASYSSGYTYGRLTLDDA